MKYFIEKNAFTLLFIGLILLFSLGSLIKFSMDDSNKYVEITVSHGDTLWNIAQQYKYNNIETSKFIAILEKMNNLNGDILKAGDVLIIPVKENDKIHLSMNE